MGVGLIEVLDHVSQGVDGVVGAVFFGGWGEGVVLGVVVGFEAFDEVGAASVDHEGGVS